MIVYRETYCGVGFHLTDKGYWFFDRRPPVWGHWCRFFHPGEEGVEAMRTAIDRMRAGCPVYTGDLREQPEEPRG